MFSLVCRVCLVSDVRMHCIGGDLGLQEIYEKVTSTKLYTEDKRPVTICYMCCSQLQKCNRFAAMSRRAEELLTNLIDNDLEIMQQNLSVIPNLTVTATTFISLDLESDSESAPGAVKEEFCEAEESDVDGFAADEIWKIEPFQTKDSSVVDYFCDVCNELFESESSMVTHFQTHAQENSVCNTPLSSTSSPKIYEDVNTQSSFICDHCNRAYSRKYNLRHHMKAHYRINSYACKQCNSSFTFHRDLQEHSKIHRKFRKLCKYKCNICGKTLSQRSAWRRHMKVHTGEKPYACDQCHVTFNQSCSLKRHKIIHTKPQESQSLKCKKCKKPYKRFGSMQIHVLNCTGVERTPKMAKTKNEPRIRKKLTRKNQRPPHKPRIALKQQHICHICGKEFKSTNGMNDHIRRHTGERPYTCEYCNKTFISKSAKNLHERFHTGIKPHACNSCGKAFFQKNSLRVHLTTHTGILDRKFACDKCNKSYSTRRELINHMRSHTGERPFSCGECNKMVSTLASLKTHLSLHSKKKYTCSICNKKFVYPGNLKVHMFTHTGQKPYSCIQCAKTFVNTSNLKTHNKVHHPELEQRCK